MSDTPTPHITQEAAREMLAALRVVLDHADYTDGACRPNEPVAGVLPIAIITKARAAIARATGGEARS